MNGTNWKGARKGGSDTMKKLACLLMLLMLLAGCGAPAAETASAPELLEPAGMKPDTEVAVRGSICVLQTYEGLVMPETRELSFPGAGVLSEVNVCVGSDVTEGQVLARLDYSVYEASLAALEDSHAYSVRERELSLKKARLQLELAEAELEQLKAAGAGQDALRLQEIRVEELENTLRRDTELWAMQREESELRIAQLRELVAGSVITAPCDGTVLYCTAAEGGYAMSGNPLIWLAEPEACYISSPYLTADQIARADAVYAAVDGQELPVEYVPMERAEYLSLKSMGLPMKSRFELPAGAEGVEAGMSAVIFLKSRVEEDALIVPSGAVHKESSGYFVYKMVDGVQQRCSVTLGVIHDAQTQILSGLEEGDVVYVGN